MNKLILLILFIFSISISAQDKGVNIQHIYISELINSIEENTFTSFDTDDIEWRKKTIAKITSNSNVQEASFLKTAMVLYMLQYKLGDKVFFKGIENYKSFLSNENKKINIADLQYFLENESGVELTRFFNDWFKSKGHPSYHINWFQNETTNDVSFTIKQIQSDPSVSFFELPIPIKLKGIDNESQLVRLEISENGQNFTANIPFIIESVEIDPEHQLISKDNIAKIGIDQELLYNNITLYPNPAINLIQIQNSSDAVVEKVSIFNTLGKLVLEETNPLSAISLKTLSVGIHLVKIETSQGTLHKTILKK